MSTHSECGGNGCPHCVGDGWTKFARKLQAMNEYPQVPKSIRNEIDCNATDKTLEEEG